MKGTTPQGKLFAIWLGLLSLLSGFVNIATLLLFATPSTHMTGNLSQFILALVQENFSGAGVLFGVLVAFVSGGVVSGLLFADKVFRWGNRYGILMILFSIVLLMVDWLAMYHQLLYVLAFTIGTQNGMFIYYNGMIIRTSHFTGYLTDTGFAIGRWIRGHREEQQKIIFYVTSMLCFLLGGIISYYVTVQIREKIILWIAAGNAFVGLYYFILRIIKRHNEERDI